MKILIVSHQFLPHQSPRTTRWKLIYDELLIEGYEVYVITGTPQEKNNENVLYIGNKRASKLVKNLRDKSNIVQISKFKNVLFNLLKKIYRFFYKTFAWPDYTMFWLFSIWRNRNKINFDYDLIISVSLPFSSHVAAYIINKSRNKKWIIDIGDPFSLKQNALENNKYLYKSLNYYFENKFYNLANQIIFTHSEAAEEHLKFFNISNEKILIGNPISSFEEDIFFNSKNYDYNSLPIIIGYFGILTKGVRSPEETLKFFHNSEVLFYWFTNQESKNMISQSNFDLSNHKFFEIISREEALDKMSSSMHCLLSIGNLNSSQLPSKVIEYISTGKPVIHFAEISNDPVIKLADKYQNLIVINKDSKLSETLELLNSAFENINNFEKSYFIENFTAKAITKKLKII